MGERLTVFSLGTNLGDRQANIKTALSRLDEELGSPYLRVSPVIETEAMGFDGEPFLNCVVEYSTALEPEQLLSICKKIEREMGRTDPPEYDSEGRRVYRNRIMDIDILLCGDLRIHTDKLTIPHPQVDTRPFIKKLLLLL